MNEKSIIVTPQQLIDLGIRFDSSSQDSFTFDLSQATVNVPETEDNPSDSTTSQASVITTNVIIPETQATQETQSFENSYPHVFVPETEESPCQAQVLTSNVIIPETQSPDDSSSGVTETEESQDNYLEKECVTQNAQNFTVQESAHIEFESEETSEYSGSRMMEEVEIFDESVTIPGSGGKERKPHHKGPIVAGYLSEPDRRQKCFNGRKKTMLTSAEFLHVATNAYVYLVIKSPDSGKIYIYDSAKTTYRNCGTQFGEPSPDLGRRSSTRANPNTPVKDNRKRKSLDVSEFPHLNVKGLPSSKRRKTSTNPPKSSLKQPNAKASKPQTLVKKMSSNKGKTLVAPPKSPKRSGAMKVKESQNTVKNVPSNKSKTSTAPPSPSPSSVKDAPSNKGKTAAPSKSPRKPRVSKKKISKCKCGIDFGSKKDEVMRRQKGRKADWVGCDAKPCDVWGHACCVGLVIQPRKKTEDHSFFCPEHRPK